MTTTERNIEIVRKYLALIEAGQNNAETLGEIMHPEVQLEVFPNAVTPRGAKSDLKAMAASSELGRKLLTGQRYEIVNVVAAGDTVVAEVVWTGTMAIDAGHLKAGEHLRAHCALILELRDGRIYRQRNYDCYDPRA